MQAPLHFGTLDGAHGVGAVGNPACGDVVTMRVRMMGDVIERVRFESMGSPYQLATASVLCDVAEDHTIDDILSMDSRLVVGLMPDLPREKFHLVRLAMDALQLAVTDAQGAGPSA